MVSVVTVEVVTVEVDEVVSVVVVEAAAVVDQRGPETGCVKKMAVATKTLPGETLVICVTVPGQMV